MKSIIICILIILITALITFPLILKMDSYIPGFFSTDESFAALSNFWWLKHAFIHHFNDTHYSGIAVPFGMDVKSGYPLWNAINKWLSILTNHIFAYNLEIFFSFFASAFFMYYLTFSLTKNTTSGIFSAIIYAFCPYHFARVWQHLGLAQIQWMPLFLLALIKLKENLSKRNLLIATLCILSVVTFELHYAIFMYICSVLFLVYCIIFYKKIDADYLKFFKMVFVTLSIGAVFVLSAPSAFTSLKRMLFERGTIQPSAWNLVRPFEALFTQSARPLSYILPAAAHPIFGKFVGQFVGTPLYGMSFTEHTLYLGWAPLVLAFVAFKRWRKTRKARRLEGLGTVPFGYSHHNREDFYIGFFVFLAIAAWLFSQPPWWNIGKFKIYMPSFFMYKILPMFRAYCRFGIVVMLAVAVLAGFGLKFILERSKTQKARIAITSLFCGLVLFEFWNWPAYKVIDVSKVPAVYYWLKEQHGDIVIAEYPLDADSPNELYKFFQTTHERKIINGTIPGTYAHKVAQEIRRLSELRTASHLKWMGVMYVLVHKEDYLKTDLIEDKEDLEKIPQSQGLRFVKSFPPQECPDPKLMCVQKTGPIDVYEVVASAIEPRVKE